MTRKRKSVASEDAGDKPMYLVVEHEIEDPSQSHSLVIAGTTTPPAMVPLRHAKRGMSFAVVDSRWIVGVGGDYRCHFTIYDLTTSTESGGPWLFSNKVNPILIPHRDMLYILSSRPKIDKGAEFLPWFEMIIFRNGRVPQPCACASHTLPPPPIFPYCINPLEYLLDPPDVRVVAYAVVGSRILLSVSYAVSDSVRQQLRMQIPPEDPPEEKGTCAFDVDTREWEMVHRKNLPFLGEAVPLGGHLFAATRSEDGAVSVYHIEILTVSDSREKTELRVLELPLVGRRIVLGQLLGSSGEGRFSTFDVRFKNPTDSGAHEKVRIVHRTYGVTVVDTNRETADQRTNAPASVVVKRRRKRIHEIVDPSRRLACSTPLVAALTV